MIYNLIFKDDREKIKGIRSLNIGMPSDVSILEMFKDNSNIVRVHNMSTSKTIFSHAWKKQ